MKINDEDINNLLKEIDVSKSFLKNRGNGILLSDEDVNILKNYNINYELFKNVSDLIFEIESYLNDFESEELELLSSRLSEYQYYHNTFK